MFGVQGALGGCFAAGWKKLAHQKYATSFNNNVISNFGDQYQLYAMMVSAGIGLAIGLLAGLLTYLTNYIARTEYFDDGYYWRNTDNIRPLPRRSQISEVAAPIKPITEERKESTQKKSSNKQKESSDHKEPSEPSEPSEPKDQGRPVIRPEKPATPPP